MTSIEVCSNLCAIISILGMMIPWGILDSNCQNINSKYGLTYCGIAYVLFSTDFFLFVNTSLLESIELGWFVSMPTILAFIPKKGMPDKVFLDKRNCLKLGMAIFFWPIYLIIFIRECRQIVMTDEIESAIIEVHDS